MLLNNSSEREVCRSLWIRLEGVETLSKLYSTCIISHRRNANQQCLAAKANNEAIIQPPEGKALPVVFAIFGGDKPEHTPSQRYACCKEAYRDPVEIQVNLLKLLDTIPETL